MYKIVLSLLFLYCTGCVYGQAKTKEADPVLIISRGHSGYIGGTFSPDGRKLLVFGNDLQPSLWDINTARITRYLQVASNILEAFFIDQSTLVTVHADGRIIYRDGIRMASVYSSPVISKDFFRVLISDNRKVVSFYEQSGQIINWDVRQKKIISTLPPLKGENRPGQAYVSSDATLVAATSFPESRVRVWETATGKKIHDAPVDENTGFIYFINKDLHVTAGDSTRIYAFPKYSYSRSVYAGTNNDRAARTKKQLLVTAAQPLPFRRVFDELTVTDYKTGELLQTIKDDKNIIDYTILDDTTLLSFNEEGTITFFDIRTGEPSQIIENRSVGRNKKICTDRDHGTIAVISNSIFGDFSLRLLDMTSKMETNSFTKAAKNITDIEVNKDFTRILFNGENSLQTWQIGQQQLKNTDTYPLLGLTKDQIIQNYYRGIAWTNTVDEVEGFQYNPKTGQLFTHDTEISDKVKVWDKDLNMIDSIPVGDETISHIRIDTATNRLFIGMKGGSFRVHNLATKKEINYELLHGNITGCRFLPDPSKLLVTTDDSIFSIDLEHAKIAGRFPVRNDNYVIGRTNNWILYDDGQAMDLATGKLLFRIPGMVDERWGLINANDSIVAFQSKENDINIYDIKKNQVVTTLKNISGEVRDLVFCKNDQWLVASLSDRTTRVYDLKKGRELFFFVLFGETDYLVQTGNGFYMGTPNAIKNLHYVMNDQVISLEQLDLRYNRPDKVLEIMGFTDSSLIQGYRSAWLKRIRRNNIDTVLFTSSVNIPSLAISRVAGKTGDPAQIGLQLKSRNDKNKLQRVNIWVNEVPLFGKYGKTLPGQLSIDTILYIKLSAGLNRIEAAVTAQNGTESLRKPLYVFNRINMEEPGKTWFIGIGIDRFSDTTHDLRYSTKDIRDLSAKLKEKYGDEIIIDTLFNDKVTVANVKALKQKLQRSTENDKVIIAYSGHGLLSSDYDYYLSTYSVNFSKPEENGLPYDELENLLDSIPARKKLILIDACHSGEVDKEDLVTLNAAPDSLIKGLKPVAYKQQGHLGLKNSFELMQSLFVNVGKSTGATIISAASGTQFALERNDLENGVFTYSILEAMKKYPSMKVSRLRAMVSARVEELTKGLQQPTSRNEMISSDWDIW